MLAMSTMRGVSRLALLVLMLALTVIVELLLSSILTQQSTLLVALGGLAGLAGIISIWSP